jgi:hypothetical protein
VGQIHLRALSIGLKAPASEPIKRQALLVTTCLAAAGAAAAFIQAYPSKAHADTIVSTATNAPQTWNSGGFTVTNTGTIATTAAAITATGSGQTTLSNSGRINGSNGVELVTSVVAASIVNNTGGLIVGQVNAIAVDGTLSALSNSGSLLGSAAGLGGAGVYVPGTLGTLTNSGSIGADIPTSSFAGIKVGRGGTITSIVNNSGGTISGTSAAISIRSGGSIGAITNSGVIAGVINNQSARDLTLSSDSQTGTLTASNGSGGVINTLSNLSIVGSVYTDQSINVSGHTLFNDRFLALGAVVSVTGAYVQTNADLMIRSGAELLVSGTASFNNAGVSLSGLSPTANYLTTDPAVTVASAAAGLTVSGSFYGYDNLGVTYTESTVGHDLRLTRVSDYVGGSLVSLSNSGDLGGAYGLRVADTGSLGAFINQASGAMSGSTGLVVQGTIGAVTNNGLIQGYSQGVYNSGVIGTLTNAGVIQGVGGMSGGLGLVNQGSIHVLSNSGSIIGASHQVGVYNWGVIDTLSNSGTIVGPSWAAVFNRGVIGTLINSGMMGGSLSRGGLVNESGPQKRIVQAYTKAPLGESMASIGALTNQSGGVISGYSTGVYNAGMIGTLTNQGSIQGDIGVYNDVARKTGSIGVLNNSGVISGGATGIYNAGLIGQLINTGTISGSVALWSGGFTSSGSTSGQTVVGSISVLNNSGVILGGATGIYNAGAIGQLINAGTISGSVALWNGAFTTSSGQTVVGSIGQITNSGVIEGNTGIYNAGSIGTIINTGTILATVASTAAGVITTAGVTKSLSARASRNAAIWNDVGASIGLISNSGMISGHTGILNAGSIGAINNSGVITGATALYLSGTIGQITNSGVIAGNIVNASGADLTIAGGSGTVYGLLTGLNGSIGTISDSIQPTSSGSINTVPENEVSGGNVTLSGNVLLNDILVLGNHNLVNTGVLQINNAISITGGFSQTGGALMSGVTSPTRYGELFVSGSANVAGGGVGLQQLSPALLATGQSYTIIQASTLTLSSSVTGVVSGFNVSISTVTAGSFQDLVLTLGAPISTSTPTPPPASKWTYVGNQEGGPASPIGVLLDKIAGGSSSQAQQFQATILTYLSGLTLAQQEHALNQMSPTQLSALTNVAATSPALNAILQHLDVFAAARGEVQVASLSDDYYGDVYGEQGRGMWGKIVGGGAVRTDSASAYGATDYGLVFGADLYRTPQALWGVTVSWLHANATGHQDLTGETTGVDSYQFTAYGALKPQAWGGHWLVSGEAAVALDNYKQSRRIDAFNVTAGSQYEGQQYLLNGTVGYVINRQGYNLTPYTGFREVHVTNPAYAEAGAGQLDMQINAVTLDSFTQETGVKYDGVASWAYGKLFPTLTLAWTHDYTSGPIPITGSLAGVTFEEPAKRAAADGLAIGAGVNAQLKGWSIGLEYQGDIRSDFQSHTAAIKANWKF